jgi:ribonuclease-3
MLNDEKLNKLQKIIEYQFNNLDILIEALTHKSYAIERNSIHNNERLEFLGDSILSAATAIILYNKFPKETEGKLSKLKSQIVSADNLSYWAYSIDLGSFIFLGANENNISAIRANKKLLCDCFEALIGAVFLDSSFEKAKSLIQHFIDSNQDRLPIDYKSELQEIMQLRFKELPVYKINREFGPDHDKSFEIVVCLQNKSLGKGIGKSKKEAEQFAAQEAIRNVANHLKNN